MSDNMSEGSEERIVAFVTPDYGGVYSNEGFVFSAEGTVSSSDFAELGRDLGQWGIFSKTPDDSSGLFVWEGRCPNAYQLFHGGDFEPDYQGSWRRPKLEDVVAALADINGPDLATELANLRKLVDSALPFVEQAYMFDDAISRHAPLTPEDQAAHDNREWSSEVWLRNYVEVTGKPTNLVLFQPESS